MFARFRWLIAATVASAALVWGPNCRGGDISAADPYASTTELGVTVTGDEIIDSFEETMSLWPAIRKYVISADFAVADETTRMAADAYIGQVQRELQNRLMGENDAAALDLIRYATWSIRRAHFFRQLRDTIDRPEAMVKLRDTWYRNFLEAVAAGGPVKLTALEAAIEPHLRGLALSPQRHAEALRLWSAIGHCMLAMESTQTGRLVREADRALEGRPEASLTRQIVAAAEWASIMKSHPGKAVRDDFITAWDALNPPSELAAAAVAH